MTPQFIELYEEIPLSADSKSHVTTLVNVNNIASASYSQAQRELTIVFTQPVDGPRTTKVVQGERAAVLLRALERFVVPNI